MGTDAVDQGSAWDALSEALEFAAVRFSEWQQRNVLSAEHADSILREYQSCRERCQAAAAAGQALPTNVVLPPGMGPRKGAGWLFRLWQFVGLEVHRHAAERRLNLAEKHACLNEVKERLAAIRRRVQETSAEIVTAEIVPAEPVPSAAPANVVLSTKAERTAVRPAAAGLPRKPLLEMLLDPRSIQWLLALGGALIVVGLVILLWVNSFFTPPVVALLLGLTNAAALAIGIVVLQKTRFQTVGKAIALLACLVMPLNLWYYNANGLVTLDGHLWAAAVVISALYAAAALVVKDETFVYIFVGGVTLTGLLILADLPPSPQKFWEIASPASLLVVLGLLCIHAERAYPDIEGPFSRRRFGLAFFWSGHVVLAAGLLLVLGAQIAGWWLYEPFFKRVYERLEATPSPIVGELKLLAFALVVAGTYAYIYSDVVVRRLGVYVHIAAGTLVWAEVLLIDLLKLKLGVDALIAVFAVTSLAVNLLQYKVTRDHKMTRAFPVFGLLLGMLPVVLGVWVFVEALGGDLRGVWQEQRPAWSYVGAMLLAAISCRVGAFVYRHEIPRLSAAYFFATAAATMVGAVALLAALGQTTWPQHAPWLMFIPIAYVVAAHLYRGHASAEPLIWVSHAAAAVMLVSSLASAQRGFTVVEGEFLNLALALFFAEAALFYYLAVIFHRQPFAVHLGTLMACGTIWQLLTYWGVAPDYYTLAFALLGMGLLLAYWFAVFEEMISEKLAEAAFQSANTILSLALVSAVLMGLSRLATQSIAWSFVGLCILLTLLSLIAAGLVREAKWRRWYMVTTVGEALVVFLSLQVLSTLTGWQKLEIFSTAVGLLMLTVGHIGWYHEQDRETDLVTVSLLLGSLLAGVPLAVATLIDRYRGEFGAFPLANELGFLAISLALLSSGVVLRLKSTTLCGAVLTFFYFVTLLILLPWSRLNTVAVAIIAAGSLLFGSALLLSWYRERLLALPEQIKGRSGVFKVLNWR